jgi:tetratricopeptide (TPR) repeat protein
VNKPIRQSLAILSLAVAAFACRPIPVSAQEAETSKPNEKLLKQLLQRLDKVERELARLKTDRAMVPDAKGDQKIFTLIETPYLGATHYRTSNGIRFFAARLVFINLTPREVIVKTDEITLNADGTAIKLGDIPRQIQFQSFQVGNQRFQLNNLKTAKQVKLPAGGTGSTWVVFTKLPRGNHIPKLVLKMNLGGKKSELNVNEFALGLLGLNVERIGPRRSLALLTISGTMNTINIAGLIDTLDRLTAQKVGRVVIRWTGSAAPLDSQLLQWFQQAALQAGRGEVSNSRFPAIPVAIRELHLAQIPNQNVSRSRSPSKAPTRIHKTDLEAVSAALRSAYQVLPRDELLQEIEEGHPLTRAAALAGGGGRLPDDKLPVVLKYADDNDLHIQRAAMIALRHFGEQAAIDKLLHYARKNAEPLATVAIESLAASRYSIAHQNLLQLLKNEGPDSKKTIVKVLARYPRPIWSETIYEFVTDTSSGAGREALHALVRVGHPKLIEVLKQLLEQKNAALKTEALNVLIARTDTKSEQIAMNYTLAHLKHSSPNQQMLNLLSRTKDRRAVELLLTHWNKSKENRSAITNTLAQIGDQSVAKVLVAKYPQLTNHEKAAVLNALLKLKSTKFRQLAGQALHSNDGSLVNTACQGLQADGGSDAVQLLIDALEKSANTSTWSYTSNALAMLGTSEAQAALQKARESENENKRNYAVNALRNLRQRSPGFQYVYQAQSFAKQKKWKEAVQQYTLALKLDPKLSEAYAGRGETWLMQNKYKKAKSDLLKAMKLDPYNSQAVTGVGIATVFEGNYLEGIKLVEDARSKFTKDRMFAYRTACVYSRALEQVNQNKDIADRDKKISTYQKKALAELKRAVKLGYRDFASLKKDPHLKPLHDLTNFKKIHTPAATPQVGAAPGQRPLALPVPSAPTTDVDIKLAK